MGYSEFRENGFKQTRSSTGLNLKAKQAFVEFGNDGKVKMFNPDAITILAAGGVDIPSTLRTQDLEIAGVSLENYIKNIVLKLSTVYIIGEFWYNIDYIGSYWD